MTGIAKILVTKDDGKYTQTSPHAGMGIILDSRHILTCAHVINRSLDRQIEESIPPGREVPVTFPKVNGTMQTRMGSALLWSPMGEAPTSDLAVLEFADDLPSPAGQASFDDDGIIQVGDTVQIFGIRGGETQAKIVSAIYKGDVESDLGQIDGGAYTQAFIADGYSGAAATDSSNNVVGMIVAL